MCIKVGRWYADAWEWISKSSQPPQFEIYVEWCGDGSLRLECSPYLGCMRLETLLWFITYDYHIRYCSVGTSWIPPHDDRHLYFLVLEYICWLSCAKRKIYIIHARRNYFYENLHTLIITWEYQKFGVDWKIDNSCIMAMGDRRMSGSVKVKTAMVDWKRGKELFEMEVGNPDT